MLLLRRKVNPNKDIIKNTNRGVVCNLVGFRLP